MTNNFFVRFIVGVVVGAAAGYFLPQRVLFVALIGVIIYAVYSAVQLERSFRRLNRDLTDLYEKTHERRRSP